MSTTAKAIKTNAIAAMKAEKANAIAAMKAENAAMKAEHAKVKAKFDNIIQSTSIYKYEKAEKAKANAIAKKSRSRSFFTPVSNQDLRVAVREWIEDETGAKAKYGSITTWNTERITSMSSLFHNAYEFNDDIGSWNVSNVTNMSGMFKGASNFNQDIGKWDVRNVTSMHGMFEETEFNQDIDSWDVSNVTDMFSFTVDDWEEYCDYTRLE